MSCLHVMTSLLCSHYSSKTTPRYHMCYRLHLKGKFAIFSMIQLNHMSRHLCINMQQNLEPTLQIITWPFFYCDSRLREGKSSIYIISISHCEHDLPSWQLLSVSMEIWILRNVSTSLCLHEHWKMSMELDCKKLSRFSQPTSFTIAY